MNLKVILIAGTVIVILSGALAIQQVRLERTIEERDQAISYSLSKDDSLEYMTTKLGQVTSRSIVQDLTIRNLQKLVTDRDLAWIKEIKGINKRMNNVEQIASTTARAVATFKIPLGDTTIFSLDSLQQKFKTFDNQNKWIRLRGLILSDTVVVKPEVSVPLQSVVYWERQKGFLGLRWFGKKEWFQQTKSDNPYVTITEDELIRVSKRKPK